MPASATTGSHSAEHQKAVPLKRWQACATCRKKKLRCSGTRPTCQYCLGHSIDCVYENVKPKSRITALEQKIADLESLLTTQNGSSDPSSTSSSASSAPHGSHHKPSFSSGTFPYPANVYDNNGSSNNDASQPLPTPSTLLHDFFPSELTAQVLGTGGADPIGNFFGTTNYDGAGGAGGLGSFGLTPMMSPRDNAVGSGGGGASSNSQSSLNQGVFDGQSFSKPQKQALSFNNKQHSTGLDAAFSSKPSSNENVSAQTFNGINSASNNSNPPEAAKTLNEKISARGMFQDQWVTVSPPGSSNPSTFNARQPSRSSTAGSILGAGDPSNEVDYPMDQWTQQFIATTPGGGMDTNTLFTSSPESSSNLNPNPPPPAAAAASTSTPSITHDIFDSIYGAGPSNNKSSDSPSSLPPSQYQPQPVSQSSYDILPQTQNRVDVNDPWNFGGGVGERGDGTNYANDMGSGGGMFSSSVQQQPQTQDGQQAQAQDDEDELFLPESVRKSLIGGDDQSAIPDELRDHLIQVFLSRRRQFGGGPIHLPSFLESVKHSDPKKRPHPALMLAIYAASCRLSPFTSLRDMEGVFLRAARKSIDDGFMGYGRLKELIQAALVLHYHYMGTGRYPTAWLMSGLACRMIVTAGLHRIESPVFRPSSSEWSAGDEALKVKHMNYLTSLRRTRVVVHPPPCSDIDMWETVNLFWHCFLVDRLAGTIMIWTAAIPDHEIITPFPRPLVEHLNHTVLDATKQTMADLLDFTDPPLQVQQDFSLLSLQVKAVTLAYRASRLMDPFSFPFGSAMRNRPTSSASISSGGSKKPLRSATSSGSPASTSSPDSNSANSSSQPHYQGPVPMEISSLRNQINNLIRSIPEIYQNPTRLFLSGTPPWHPTSTLLPIQGGCEETFDPLPGQPSGINAGVGYLHTIIYVALQLVCEEESHYNPAAKAEALAAARGVVSIITALSNYDFGQLDSALAALWTLTSRTLLAEAKRLMKVGDFEKLAMIEVEIEVLLLACRRLGAVLPIGKSQASFVAKLSKLDIEDNDEMIESN